MDGGGGIETALLLSCTCAFARVGVSAGVRRTNEQVSAVCMQVRVRAFVRAHARIGAQVRVGVCVRAVSACVRVEVSV